MSPTENSGTGQSPAFDGNTSESAIHYPLILPKHPGKRAIKLWLGSVLKALLPARAQRVLREGDPMQFGMLDRLLLAGHLAEAHRTQRWEALAPVQQRFWAGQGGRLFNTVQGVADRFQQWFLGPHQAVVDALAAEVGNGQGWRRLVELGSGNGLALNHLSQRFAALPVLIGVDLNAEATAANAQRHNNPRLQFVAAEAVSWVQQHTEPDTIWFSNAGVLEYLIESQVSAIYAHIAQHGRGACFALVEPISPQHQLDQEPASRINALEHSYSHNHPALLERNGWTILFRQEVELANLRWLMLVARIR